MNKAKFIEKIQCTVSGMSKKETSEVVGKVFEALAEAIKKDCRFSYPGFGTFIVRNRHARKGRNPQTGKEILIKASKTVAFKPAPGLKEKL